MQRSSFRPRHAEVTSRVAGEPLDTTLARTFWSSFNNDRLPTGMRLELTRGEEDPESWKRMVAMIETNPECHLRDRTADQPRYGYISRLGDHDAERSFVIVIHVREGRIKITLEGYVEGSLPILDPNATEGTRALG